MKGEGAPTDSDFRFALMKADLAGVDYDRLCVSLDLAHHIVEQHKGTYAFDKIKEITGYSLEEASE